MGPEFYWWPSMWLFPIIMPIIMVVLMLTVLYFLFGRGGFRPPLYGPGGESESALEILKKRYVKGEITKEEFEQMKKDILS